jgi:hypothetical protein
MKRFARIAVPFGGVVRIFTLIQNSGPVAGAAYRKRQAKQQRRESADESNARGPVQAGAA